MAFINSSRLLFAALDIVIELDMETFQEQIYAGINEYSNTSVYTGHRIRDVRLDYAYGMTFDGHQTFYLSLYYNRSILVLHICTDEVKVAVQSSSIQP